MGFAPAPGHARLCGGLCLYRLFAVQRPPANVAAPSQRAARCLVARHPQPVGRRLGAQPEPVPLCVFAGTHRLDRARHPADGGGPFAGRALVAAHLATGPALGPTSHCSGYRTGADGNLGRLWGGELLWRANLHRWHLQGLAGDGQPGGRSPTGHQLAAAGGLDAQARAIGPIAFALCQHQWRHPRH